MIFEFILAFIVIGIALYLPGFFVLRTVRLARWSAIAFAPFVSLPAYCILAILYDKLGIFADGWNIMAPVFVLALAIFCVGALLRKKSVQQENVTALSIKKLGFIPLAYVGVGLAIYILFYLSALPTLGHVAETYDNVYHFNQIRGFVESGIWSTLDASVYLDNTEGYPYAFLSGGTYYPAGWHLLCALPVSLLNLPVGVAANAANCVFITCVYALATCLFLNKIFKANRLMLVIGVFLAFAFGAYPWVILAHWPLYPTVVSMTMVPLLCLAFMLMVDPAASRKQRVIYALLFVVGVMTEAFCQPSSVFVMMVILIPYVIQKGSKILQTRFGAWRQKRGCSPANRVVVRVISAIVLSLIAFGMWFAFFSLPFLQPTVNYYWPPIMSTPQALASSVSLSLALPLGQYALGILVLLGILYVIVKRRDLVWVVVAYIMAVCIFIAAASLGNCWLKHFLAGFWYTDPYRAAAVVGVVGMPLAVIGLYALIKTAQRLLDLVKSTDTGAKQNKIAAGVIIVLVCCAIYSPVAPGNLPFFKHVQNITATHGARQIAVAYTDTEKEFVNEVNDFIDEDDVVVNHPYDGSMMAYGLSDLPAYYRSIAGYGRGSESEEGVIMRERLSDLAFDEQVQEAVRETSADYVLMLANGRDQLSFTNAYEEELWRGIEAINEDTPGFELVLSEGDMKLYKIVAP